MLTTRRFCGKEWNLFAQASSAHERRTSKDIREMSPFHSMFKTHYRYSGVSSDRTRETPIVNIFCLVFNLCKNCLFIQQDQQKQTRKIDLIPFVSWCSLLSKLVNISGTVQNKEIAK